jgi:proteasome lid subunit RPN8/RPN11
MPNDPDQRADLDAPFTPTSPPPEWDAGVLQSLYEAAFSKPDSEIVGVLVGQPSLTGRPRRISAMIPASTSRPPERAQLDHRAWAYVHSTMARYYGGLDIVGWWVSRPGPNTELDRPDLEAAAESFARPSQIGFVFDSQHRRAALYGWHKGRYTLLQEQLVPRRLTRAPGRGARSLQPALLAFCLGLGLGIAGWLAAGSPALTAALMVRVA